MFARKSSSHNLLFRKPITRSVTFTHISTLVEEGEDESAQEPVSGLGNTLMSASMPAFKTPLNLDEEDEQPTGGLRWFRELTNRSKWLIAILCLVSVNILVIEYPDDNFNSMNYFVLSFLPGKLLGNGFLLVHCSLLSQLCTCVFNKKSNKSTVHGT